MIIPPWGLEMENWRILEEEKNSEERVFLDENILMQWKTQLFWFEVKDIYITFALILV